MSLEGKIAPSSPSRRKLSLSSRTKTTTTTTRSRRSITTPKVQSKDEAKTTTTTYPRWHSTVAGATSGAGARLLTAPLDLLKIRRQLAVSTTATTTASATPVHQSSNIFDSLRQIYKTEGGLRSLFRGNVAATYLWIGYAAIQFTLYTRTSDLLTSFHKPPHELLVQPPITSNHQHNPLSSIVRDVGNTLTGSPTAVAFLSGASAGVCATLVTYPFDICRTTFAAIGLHNAETGMGGTFSRGAGMAAAVEGAKVAKKNNNPGMMMKPPRTVWDFAKTMYKSRGIKGFYAGCGPALIQIVPYMGINFAVYDSLVRWQKGKTNVGNAGVAGVIAGGTSKLLVYPLDTVKKRLQAQAFFFASSAASLGSTGSGGVTASASAAAAMERGVTYTGMMDCFTTVLKEEGVGALYRGLVPTVLKSCVGTGCSFAFFQLSKNVLEGLHDGRRKRQEEEEEKDDSFVRV